MVARAVYRIAYESGDQWQVRQPGELDGVRLPLLVPKSTGARLGSTAHQRSILRTKKEGELDYPMPGRR